MSKKLFSKKNLKKAVRNPFVQYLLVSSASIAAFKGIEAIREKYPEIARYAQDALDVFDNKMGVKHHTHDSAA